MNKKFINLLLASVLTAGAVQVFTSCKDNEADLQKNQQFEYESLEARVKANEDKLAAIPGQLEALETKLTNDLNAAKTELTNNMNSMKTELENKMNTMKSELTTAIGDAKTELQNNINLLEAALRGELNDLKQEMLNKFIENDAKLAVMQGQIDQNITNITNLQTDLAVVQADLATANAAIAVLQGTVAEQGTKIATLEATLAQVQADLSALTTKVDDYIAATDPRLQALEAFMNEWNPVLPEIQKNAAEALAKANANAANIEAINDVINELKDADASNASLIAGLQMKIDNIMAQLENVATLDDLSEVATYLQNQARNYYQQAIGYTNLMIEQVLGQMNAEFTSIKDFQAALDQRLTDLEGTVNDLGETVESLDQKISDLNDKIDGIQEQLDDLTGRVSEIAGRISSIVIQGTNSPVFGSIRLPLGIQSNLLVAYLGEVANSGGQITFPLYGTETAWTYNNDASNILTDAEAAALKIGTSADAKVKVQTIEGAYMNKAADGSGLLGSVYATINPSKVDVDNFSFSLVNSRGEKVASPLTFTPSDDLLTFGISRATSDNGFYVAEATIDPKDEAAVNSVRFHFNDNLKNTIREILKAPKASLNKNTVMQLAAAIYDQLNGFLPAIGIEASWNDSEKGDMKVTSNYAIATAVAKPLSFRTLIDYKPGHHIPTLLPAIDKIQDKFNVMFDELTGKIKIDLLPEGGFEIKNENGGDWIHIDEITINLEDVQVTNPDPITVTIVVDGTEYTSDPVDIDITGSIEGVIASLQSTLTAQLAGITGQINDVNGQLDKLVSDISDQVNELLNTMQENVNTTITEVVNDIKNKVNGVFDNTTLNGLLGRMDAVINRLNTMMDNINYYLQPALFYTNAGNYGLVSANPAMPSVMVVNNDAAGITIVPTTYTFETVVPVYEKYVCVTKAWKNGDATKANQPTYVLEANDNTGFNTNMNTILDGSVRKVALKLQKGITYEIFYQAVDFNGYVSGRKYYISVK